MPSPHETPLTMRSGAQVMPFRPAADQLNEVDIAEGLTRRFRYNGQAGEYTVAAHCINCVLAAWSTCSADVLLWLLLHDAAEAYLPDVPRPLRKGLGWRVLEGKRWRWRSFEDVEDGILQIVAWKYGLAWPMPELVRLVDDRLLATEVRRLFPHVEPAAMGATAEPFPTFDMVGQVRHPDGQVRSFLYLLKHLQAVRGGKQHGDTPKETE